MVILLNTNEHDALQILLTIHKLALTPALRECLKPFAEEVKTIEFHGLACLSGMQLPIDGQIVDVEYYQITKLGFYVLDCYEDFQLSDPAKKVYNKIVNYDDGKACLKIYSDYSEMLTKEDVTAWYADQFNMANKEREQLKTDLATEKEQHEGTKQVLDNYTRILEQNNLL